MLSLSCPNCFERPLSPWHAFRSLLISPPPTPLHRLWGMYHYAQEDVPFRYMKQNDLRYKQYPVFFNCVWWITKYSSYCLEGLFRCNGCYDPLRSTYSSCETYSASRPATSHYIDTRESREGAYPPYSQDVTGCHLPPILFQDVSILPQHLGSSGISQDLYLWIWLPGYPALYRLFAEILHKLLLSIVEAPRDIQEPLHAGTVLVSPRGIITPASHDDKKKTSPSLGLFILRHDELWVTSWQ